MPCFEVICDYCRRKRNTVCPTSTGQRVHTSDTSSDESGQVTAVKSRPHVRWCTHDDVIITHDLSTYEQGSGHQNYIDYAKTSSLQRNMLSDTAFDKHHSLQHVNKSRSAGHLSDGTGQVGHLTTRNEQGLMISSSSSEQKVSGREKVAPTALISPATPTTGHRISPFSPPMFAGSSTIRTLLSTAHVPITRTAKKHDESIRSHSQYAYDVTNDMALHGLSNMVSVTSLPILSEVTFDLGDEPEN